MINLFNVSAEVDGRKLLLRLPKCFPSGALEDLSEYLGIAMGVYSEVKEEAVVLLLAKEPQSDLDYEHLFAELQLKTECWFRCYPHLVQQQLKKERHLHLA